MYIYYYIRITISLCLYNYIYSLIKEMIKLLEEHLPQFYSFLNRAQKKLETNHEPIDLFVVLDISSSMDAPCNKIIHFGVGYANYGYALLGLAIVAGMLVNPVLGGILMLSAVTIAGAVEKGFEQANSRLDEAKRHLSIQLNDLIEKKRIRKLGLITFNHQSKICYKLGDNFDGVLKAIKEQQASGSTALYDSINFAAKELQGSNNPRMLIMTDGQDNSSKSKNLQWAKQWFQKSGLKSTFFTICEGNTKSNIELTKQMRAKYLKLGEKCWFSSKLEDDLIVQGMNHLA